MVFIYYAKVITKAQSFLKQLNLPTQERILDNKSKLKQQQMITAELLLNYAFKQAGFNKSLEVIYTPKPQVSAKDIYISKTHRNDFVAVAIASQNIGLDIEQIKDSITANKVLSEDEFKEYLNDKEKLFSYYWSIKEAYIKNIGFLSNSYKNIKVETPNKVGVNSRGKIRDKYYFQTFINGFSFALVSDKPTDVEIKIIEESLIVKEVKTCKQ